MRKQIQENEAGITSTHVENTDPYPVAVPVRRNHLYACKEHLLIVYISFVERESSLRI